MSRPATPTIDESSPPTRRPSSSTGVSGRLRLDRVDQAWLIAVCTLYGAFTLPRLTDRPVWVDEAFTVGATRDLVGTYRNTGGTMALYYLLVTPVARLSDSRFWLRLPSALFIMATIAVVYLIGRRIGSRSLAVVAASILAVTWSMARWGIEARGYALAILLVATSWLALISAVTSVEERTRRRWWWAYGFAIGAAPLAHGLAAIQFPVQLGALLLLGNTRRWRSPLLFVSAALFVEGFVLFGLGAGDVANWISPLAWSDLPKLAKATFGRGASEWVVAGLALVATGFAIGEGRTVWRARGARSGDAVLPDAAAMSADGSVVAAWLRTIPVLWLWGMPILILAISTVRPYQQGRYLTSSLPAVALVVAGVLVRLRPPAMATLTVLVMAILLINQPAVTTVSIERWPSLVHQLAADAEPGDLVLTNPVPRAAFDFAYAELDGPPALEPLSPTDPIGVTRRLYQPAPGSTRSQLLAADHDVWWVLRGTDDRDHATAILADPTVATRLRVVDQWDWDQGKLTLIHLTPRSRR